MHEKVFIFDDICHKFIMVMSLLWNGTIFLINEELNAELLQRTKWWSVFDKFTINQKVSKFLQFLIQALHEQNVNSHSFQHIKKNFYHHQQNNTWTWTQVVNKSKYRFQKLIQTLMSLCSTRVLVSFWQQ